jgi:ABC-type lipoprotein export system ATPase subunit
MPEAMVQNESIIKVTGLHKTYDTGKVKVQALRGIDFAVKRGEMVAIMGPSGCGKTTLLNCLAGLDDFDQGEVAIEGTQLRSMSDRKRTQYRANRMGFVFQFYNLLTVLNSMENVELPLLFSGVPPVKSRQRAMEALGMVGLTELAARLPAELSGGQRQRVTIARALVNRPAIVWGDEPTGDLDSETSKGIMDLLCNLNEKNEQTFVLVTHSHEVAERTHRIVTMRDGRIVGEK